jgi:uncharacterized protein (DUF433 family)
MNNRVQTDPLICYGKPVIKNTRVLISNILSDFASGTSDKAIIENYPSITNEDIKAAMDFGSELANF